MRALIWLPPVLLMACDLGPPPKFGDTGSSESGCPQSEWVVASSADLSISSLSVDASTRIAAFEEGATYEGYGPSACVDPDGGGAAFIYTVGGQPHGSITMIADRTGSLNLSTDGTFRVEIFGEDQPVTFERAHFVLGGWDVQSLLPLQATVTDASGQNGGRLLSLSFTAEAHP